MFRSTATITPLNVLGDDLRTLVDAADSAGSFELFEVDGHQDSGPPPHFHPWQEAYVVLDGEVDIMIAGDHQRTRPGDIAHVPANAVHTFRVVSERARFLVLSDSPESSGFFADLDAHVKVLPDDFPKVLEIAAAHGVTPVLPASA